jgi:hypothetical protein
MRAVQPPPQNFNDLTMVLRQLDRLEERTRDIATRSDLEALRKELVARETLEPQMTALKFQISQVDDARKNDRDAMEKRVDEMENEQMSKQDRLWIRLGQIIGVAGFIIAMFEFLTHLKITP